MFPTSNFIESKGEPILLFLNEKGNYTKKAWSNPNAFKIIYFENLERKFWKWEILI
jgi:hypothetical protein